MSEISEISGRQPCFIERYQGTYNSCFSVIRVAVWMIALSGLVAVRLSRLGRLDHRFFHGGIGATAVSFVVLGILFYKQDPLSMALDDVTTIEELLEIVDTIEAPDDNCSVNGCVTGTCVGEQMDFIITSTKLKGTICDVELRYVIEHLLDQETNNSTRTLDASKKTAFKRLCDLATKKCEPYSGNNNFEIHKRYLK